MPEFRTDILITLADSLKCLSGKTSEEKRLDWNAKIINFVKYEMKFYHKYNLDSFFTPQETGYRKQFILTMKSIASANFENFYIEIQEGMDVFRFRKIEKI